jgi:hypothetical protein
VFSVEPIGGGLHAVTQLDQSKFPADHPKAFEEVEKKASRKGPVKPTPRPAARADAPPLVLRTLVAYTPKVEQLHVDVGLLIQAAIDLTNTSYLNSKVGLRLELAHAKKLDYQEVDVNTDLGRFTAKNDMMMDDVHALRDVHRADVCVLLIDTSGACGMAADILAAEDTAFAVVDHGCAVDNLSFPHEVGHLQGARHNPEVDPTAAPFSDGHGYLSQQGNWRTIMAYPTAQQPNRIPYWSNPDVNHPGSTEAMGTAGLHNNARVLNLTAATLTAFRP